MDHAFNYNFVMGKNLASEKKNQQSHDELGIQLQLGNGKAC